MSGVIDGAARLTVDWEVMYVSVSSAWARFRRIYEALPRPNQIVRAAVAISYFQNPPPRRVDQRVTLHL
jgi:hypothetical protein